MFTFRYNELVNYILPAVPPTQGAAPGRVITPPSLRYLAARAAAMELVHTLCFHIMSAFLMKSTNTINYDSLSYLLMQWYDIGMSELFSILDQSTIKDTLKY